MIQGIFIFHFVLKFEFCLINYAWPVLHVSGWLIVVLSKLFKEGLTGFLSLCNWNSFSLITTGGAMNWRALNGHNTSNRCWFDVNITLKRRKENIDEFPHRFDELVISICENSTSFRCALFDVISMDKKLMPLRWTLFEAILMGKSSMLFWLTFLMQFQCMEYWHDSDVLILMCFWEIKYGGRFDIFFW